MHDARATAGTVGVCGVLNTAQSLCRLFRVPIFRDPRWVNDSNTGDRPENGHLLISRRTQPQVSSKPSLATLQHSGVDTKTVDPHYHILSYSIIHGTQMTQ